MKFEKIINTLKNSYGSSKRLACRLVKPAICFYSSLEFRDRLIVILTACFVLTWIIIALGIDLIIVFLVLFLIATAFYIIHKFNKGSEKQREGDYQKAIKYYDNVIRIHQNNRFILPILNLILGINPETGLKAPTEIPDGRVSRTHKNSIMFVQEFPYAYELDEYILRNTNIFTATYYNKGNSNVALKDHGEAIKAFDRAIEIDPMYTTAYYSRGNSKALLKKDHNGAIEDYSKAIELDPKFAGAYYNRGFAKENRQDHKEAIADYDKAIELDPKFGLAYCNRAAVKRESGDFDGAIADYDRAIELEPSNEKYIKARQQAQKKLDDAQTIRTHHCQ